MKLEVIGLVMSTVTFRFGQPNMKPKANLVSHVSGSNIFCGCTFTIINFNCDTNSTLKTGLGIFMIFIVL